MNVLVASRLLRTHWRNSAAISDAGQDVGMVVNFLHDLLLFLDLIGEGADDTVVVFSEYSEKHDVDPNRFARFYPRTEKELRENYDIMKQYLFSLFDTLPIFALNSSGLTDFECVRILQEVHRSGEKVKVFAPFDDYATLLALPGKDDVELFGDDFIRRTDHRDFADSTGFHLLNSPIFFALFGGKYVKRAVHFQKKTVLKLVPDLSSRIVGIDEFFDLCSSLNGSTVRNEVEKNRQKIKESYMFYVGLNTIKVSHIKNVSKYLSTKKRFNEAKFMVSIYKLGIVKHLQDDLEVLKTYMRYLSER